MAMLHRFWDFISEPLLLAYEYMKETFCGYPWQVWAAVVAFAVFMTTITN